MDAKKSRYLMLLAGSRRQEALNHLNHLRDLDPRWTKPIAAGTDVVARLRELGAPNTCYVMSDIEAIDGKTLELAKAVKAARQGPWGTIIGCIPGKLAYYRGENGEQELLLARAG